MSGLKTLQENFSRHLMRGDEAVSAMVGETRALPRALRLGIYRHAYYSRLAEALGNDFPGLKGLLGEAAFEQLCLDYIQAHPSRHFSLRYFGQHLAAHLGHDARRLEHDWPAEMALFEWALVDSFDARDATPLEEAEVAAIAPQHWPELRIGFHPSVQRISLAWNTLERWQAIKQERTPPAPARLPHAGDCLLWRNQLTSQFRSLDPPEAEALAAALEGLTFADLCGRLAELPAVRESVPLQAAGFLKVWLSGHMLTRLASDD